MSYYIGIDLGGTKIAAGLVDKTGKIIRKDSMSTKSGRKYQEIIKDMANLTIKLIKDEGLEVKDIQSVGIGVPGTPGNKKGIVYYACNLDFRNTPLRAEMQKYIDLPIYIENDANCAALAENIAGAAKDTAHSVTITLGTGVGGGVVINNKIYSGFNFAGSELGHSVIVYDGKQCTCGRKGCWEVYASATACIAQTREAAINNPQSLINKMVNGDLTKITAKTAFDAARQEDETGKQVVRQYIRYIAEGVINVINTFMPEVVVIGGGVSREGEYLLKPLRELVYAGVYCKGKEYKTKIVCAKMGNDAGIIGAAMLSLDVNN